MSLFCRHRYSITIEKRYTYTLNPGILNSRALKPRTLNPRRGREVYVLMCDKCGRSKISRTPARDRP